jgi:signal transduction histidine kinase
MQRVRLETDAESTDHVVLHVSVGDTGIGISPEKQRAIFDAFTQADSSMTRTHGGTDLGFTISARLVPLMRRGATMKENMAELVEQSEPREWW